jgi:hypothetical protein
VVLVSIGDLVYYDDLGVYYDKDDRSFLREDIGIVLEILPVSKRLQYAKVYWSKEKKILSHLIYNLRKFNT